MPIGTLLGGIGSGLMGGMEKGQELQLKREEAKLRTKMLDAQIKHMDAQQRVEDTKQVNLQNLMTTRRDLGNQYERVTTGSTPGAPMVESPGDNAIGTEQVEGQPGAGVQGRAMQPHEMLIKAALQDYAHPIPAGAFRNPTLDDTSEEGMFNSLVRQQNVVNRLNAYNANQQPPQGAPPPSSPQQPGVVPIGNTPQATPPTAPVQPSAYRPTFGPKGPKLAPTPLAASREPMSPEGRMFALHEKITKGIATPAEVAIFNGWLGMPGNKGILEQMRFNAGKGTGAGSQTGQLDVRQTPAYLENKTDVKEAEAKGTPIPEGAAKEIGGLDQMVSDAQLALKHFDPAMVGPFAGKAAELQRHYGETPIIGGLINSMGTGAPLTESQSTFMQASARLRNAIRTKEFGATLTGNEKKAAQEELQGMEEAPGSAKVRLQNILNIMAKAAIRQRGLTGQTRGGANVGGGATPSAGAPDGTRQMLGGKMHVKQNGEWFPE